MDIIGAPGRIRTCGTRIRNPVLYPLSYEGAHWHRGPVDFGPGLCGWLLATRNNGRIVKWYIYLYERLRYCKLSCSFQTGKISSTLIRSGPAGEKFISPPRFLASSLVSHKPVGCSGETLSRS
jgi:hypothetical protein